MLPSGWTGPAETKDPGSWAGPVETKELGGWLDTEGEGPGNWSEPESCFLGNS